MGFFSGCARMLLIVFNFFFWLSGAAILGVGIWILVDPTVAKYSEVIKDATGNGEFLKIAAYILIGFGAFIFLVGFCGCCGAIRSSKCLIGMYIFFLVLVCAGELAAGIYVAVRRNDVEDKLETGLRKSIREHYNGNLKGAWDFVQEELSCCGGKDYTDYDNSTWQAEHLPEKVPESCCIMNEDGKPKDSILCQTVTNALFYNTDGCYHALKDWMKKHSTVLIGVGCGVAALELIGLFCAICFCRHIGHDKYSNE